MPISQISEQDVHRITSGQVIIDLASAVKELVENSLDAQATQIDITFRKYGIDGLEVSDNGTGISKDDYESLALKHHTSKIKNFDDVLTNINTLGFRGEALSSLCGIARMAVITTTQPPRADRIEYDMAGHLSSKSTTTRNKGTTVIISDLFHNLPVRQKDFERTAKRHFTKCITLLQSYAIINECVRITVTNITSTGKKNNILSTAANQNLNKRIISIFGSTSLRGLSPISLTLDMNPFKKNIKNRYVDDPDFDNMDYKVKVTGLFSQNSFGCGRTSKDRQFIFMNKRPIDYPAVVKCCNEVYRTYNNVQYPMFILNFELTPDLIDVNITPDKRTVVLHNEQSVIDVLYENLSDYFDTQDMALPKEEPQDHISKRRRLLDHPSDSADDGSSSQLEISSTNESSFVTPIEMDITELVETNSFEYDGKESLPASEPDFRNDIEDDNMQCNSSPSKEPHSPDDNYNEIHKEQELSEVYAPQRNLRRPKVVNIEEFANPIHEPESYIAKNGSPKNSQESLILQIDDKVYKQTVTVNNNSDIVSIENITPSKEYNSQHSTARENDSKTESQETDSCESCKDDSNIPGLRSNNELLEYDDDKDEDLASFHPTDYNIRSPIKSVTSRTSKRDTFRSMTDNVLSKNNIQLLSQHLVVHNIDDIVNISNLKEIITNNTYMNERQGTSKIIRNSALNDLDKGAQYLSLSVKKSDFKDMKVVGQFNLGFILVTRNMGSNYDLFIVDQHASDEKFNFENLQQTTRFKSQKLISPETIELSVIDELIVMDNLSVFERNGFKIEIDEDAMAGHKVKLISIPVSKRTIFGVADFQELVYLIKEDGGTNKSNIKCSKIRAMFAMRACRSSIMVGKPLNMRTMTRVVQNLSTLDKPWNCPHGRPTMRHLMELQNWKSFSEDYKL
ncbi:MutL C terminal dimerization domain [Nakaseomyces glabratus]|nr:MutL C terminal dimerization domain [Nakaseomyces glabratus]KAH7612077.1 MutL C terminal dimerization domain [Nakaseomyces glabratus]